MLLALTVAVGGVGTACKTDGAKAGAGAARSAAATATIETADRPLSFRVELAITRDEQARGLMYRQHLDADAGMLFIYDAPSPLVFWMKNTLIPLDMIFIGSDRRIAGHRRERRAGDADDAATGRRALAVRAGDRRRAVREARDPRWPAGRRSRAVPRRR